MAAKKSRNHRIANPEMGAAFRELRQGSRCQPHTPATRKGTRRANERRAIREFA